MKILKMLILSITLMLTVNCQSNSNKLNQNFQLIENGQSQKSILDFYRQYSSFTDPGEYEYLYENLPDSLPELCSLIRSQFIHPYAELPKYQDLIPKERWNEMFKYPTVESILEGLILYDSRGLVNDRKPEDRLVLMCQQNAILLASILKYRGIPARVRGGHATYLIPDFHTSHAICEVWNKDDERWMLVDPDMKMVDFNRDLFDFSNDAWLQMQQKEIDPDLFGIPGKYSGKGSILAKVCTDLASLLGTEYPINQYAPILDFALEEDKQLSAEQIETINKISELMKSLDTENLSKLQEIYNNTPEIQMTKSFEIEKRPEARDDNNASAKNKSIDKPNIEFVNIPAGTFTMGSPDDEKGRENDETQHEVTLSSFKMSKYSVTFEQYDRFCEITGRTKPRGRKRGNLPVSMVTWLDAKAFADWMGCRLPTEAEFEYASRANTTTPFYTGECLTSEQANFNGGKPYGDCVKSKYRKKALTVGSFQPNAFGLYDMYGNVCEWCSDWYGEYDLKETLNPKGPKTGKLKILRGGGWGESGSQCRSAYRDNISPGNRGTGIGFRIVKDE